MKKLILITCALAVFGFLDSEFLPSASAESHGNENEGFFNQDPSFNPFFAPPVAITASAIDWSKGLVQTKTLSANTTFTFANAQNGQVVEVFVTNTAGNYTVTWPTVSWPGGTPPTQTVGVKTDKYIFRKVGSTIYGSVTANY